MYGGSILVLVGLYAQLLERRRGELNDEPGGNFTSNMINSSSILVELVLGWTEVHNETSSNVLSFIENIGYLYSYELPCSEENINFKSINILLTIKKVFSFDQSFCFEYEKVSICFPKSSLYFTSLNCSTFVSSAFTLQNKRTNMFPTMVKEDNEDGRQSILTDNLISLSLNNKTVQLTEGKVQIVFDHFNCQVSQSVNFW